MLCNTVGTILRWPVATAGLLLLLSQTDVRAADHMSSNTAKLQLASEPDPIRPTNRRFLLTHSTSVYRQPHRDAEVVTNVKANANVDVIGISSEWLQVRLHGGTVGYIESSAAE
jgi:uncharacterized protein YgiM (DUF1202 family)